MSSVAATALSGMNAAWAALDVAGHNIANAQTPGFRRQQLAASTAPDGGVDTTVTRAEVPGEALATDLVGLLQGKNSFLANLAVFRTANEMTGTLLDLRA